jgi:hypothetical protein
MKVYCKLSDGLGNNLFRIANAYSYSIKHNKELLCDVSLKGSQHNPFSVYYNNFFRKLNLCNSTLNAVEYKHSGFEYYEIPKFKTDCYLNGLFQNEKYFVEGRDEILSLFEIDVNSLDYINTKYGDILEQDTCSLHVRRGDYLAVSTILPVLNLEYYKNSVNEMGVDKIYLIFSNDVKWCENNLNFIKNKIIIKDNPDFIDLYLMSMCKNNIIANSSFSWWGAWLNKNKNKKVIGPKTWFGPDIVWWLIQNYNQPILKEEIIPLSWQKI